MRYINLASRLVGTVGESETRDSTSADDQAPQILVASAVDDFEARGERSFRFVSHLIFQSFKSQHRPVASLLHYRSSSPFPLPSNPSSSLVLTPSSYVRVPFQPCHRTYLPRLATALVSVLVFVSVGIMLTSLNGNFSPTSFWPLCFCPCFLLCACAEDKLPEWILWTIQFPIRFRLGQTNDLWQWSGQHPQKQSH